MDVAKIAKLANLTLTDDELKKFPAQFEQTLKVIEQLQEIDTDGVELTSQVIDLENVMRDDVIDTGRQLSQSEALAMADRSANGFFVVKQILSK